jgi:hypothetical protein
MRATLRAFLFLALLLPIGGSLAAQHRGLRPVDRNGDGDGSGFWAIVGLSRGDERYRFDIDNGWSDPFQANSFLVSAGGRISPDFTLGVEWNIWSSYEASSDQRLQALNLVGNWYPLGSPVFLKAGFGLGGNRIEDASGVFKDSGVGVTLGVGVDIPIARRVALQPRIDYYAQRYDSPGQDNDYRERLTQIGVAIRFR